jgi:hypothetical protein
LAEDEEDPFGMVNFKVDSQREESVDFDLKPDIAASTAE